MLRSSTQLRAVQARQLRRWPHAAYQWQRSFADKPSIRDPTPPVLPGSQSKTLGGTAPPPPPGPVSPAPAANPPPPAKNLTIPNVPLTPPPPPPNPAASGAPPPKKRRRGFFSYLFYLTLLTGLGFGSGVWYSMVSDNFHDFFTEYVPFGEESVLYFEEREFRKRFPRALGGSRRRFDSGEKTTIPSRSGLSWKMAADAEGGSDLEKRGRHMSALDATPRSSSPPPAKAKEATAAAKSQPAAKKSATPIEMETSKAPAKNAAPKEPAEKPKVVASTSPATSSSSSKMKPEVNEPSVYVPVSPIDPLNIKNANEPIVQDLVKILNDIITVINKEKTTDQMASTINKAKSSLATVGQRIQDLKSSEQHSAQVKLKEIERQFDDAARELVKRLEDDTHNQENSWRDEFNSERKKIAESYEHRLRQEIDKMNEVSEQRVQNQLLEQAVALKKDFTQNVKDTVEAERNGRLSRLSQLSSSVQELEDLTARWNSVIDANLQTQHLQVAVEAVKSALQNNDRPRPFIKELAALKEVAAEDDVINSAIASINPSAYQRGVSTPAQLIDRFRNVADEVRKASLLPEDAGVASHAASLVLSKVMFKKQGRTVGDDVESILTRTETLLEEGKLDDAAREMNTLTGWAKTLSVDWLAEVRRVLEVRQALDVIATEARLQSLKVD